jgi:two-component system response regulator RegX3
MVASPTSVLLVEDEDSYIDAVTLGLGREGFVVHVARDGPVALRLVESLRPDLVLLDVVLPGASGIDLCRELRQRSSVPIILVTARPSEVDMVVGLEAGADDYVTKPYRLRELAARMRAVLRRRSPAALASTTRVTARARRAPSEVLEVGDVRVDIGRHEVRIRGREVQLPLKEFELLVLLLGGAGRVVPRDVLMERIWGSNHAGDTKTLDVHIKRLRAKVELDPSQPERIVTIRGVGYRYVLPREDR